MSNRRLCIDAPLFACLAPSLALGGDVYRPLSGMPGDFQYTYYLSGFDSVPNFFPGLADAVATPDIDVQLFQPKAPAGTAGDFVVEAASDLGDVTGLWSSDFAYFLPGLPGARTYFVDQFDSDGILVGNPVEAEDVPVPEPGMFGFRSLTAGFVGGPCSAAVQYGTAEFRGTRGSDRELDWKSASVSGAPFPRKPNWAFTNCTGTV